VCSSYCCCRCFPQANELEYATKYYAAILARSTGKDLATCQKEYLSRCVVLCCVMICNVCGGPVLVA
jgi:hypothetical protein